LIELEEAFAETNIKILGLAETRRSGEKIINTKAGNLLYYIGNNAGQRGVGFLVKQDYIKNIREIKGISDRIATLQIEINKTPIVCIQIYAPTSTATDEENEEFYCTLGNLIKGIKIKKHNLIIMGDWNSQIGQRGKGEKKLIGNYGYGKCNARGWRLLRFCQEHNLILVNSFFKKRLGKRWSWVTPNQKHRTLIDYILIPMENNSLSNFDIYGMNKFKFYTDHRLLTITINKHKLNMNRRYINNKTKEINYEKYKSELNNLLEKNIKPIATPSTVIPALSVTSLYQKIHATITEAIQTAAEEPDSDDKQQNQQPIQITEAIKTLHKTRAALLKIKNRTQVNNLELNLISKVIRSKIRTRDETEKNEIIKETIEGNKNIKTMNKKLSLGNQWSTHFVNEKGEKVHDRIAINEFITDYYENLYDDKENRDYNTNTTLPPNLELEPIFIVDEVKSIISQLKSKKCPGHDKITNELIKAGGESLINTLTVLFNQIRATGKIPPAWKYSDIIIIAKKGNRHKIENYRPITLRLVIAKIFSKLIQHRIQHILDAQQPIEQAGFRKTFSTVDHLHTMNQIIEKGNEYQIILYIALIDYKKAFDTLKHEFMFTALRNQGIPEHFALLIQEMYRGLKARIKTDVEGRYFEIKRGVGQGDPLSPILFNGALEHIFRGLKWEDRGIDVNGKKISNLRFADDVILLSSSEVELNEMIKELAKEGEKSGLTISVSKTKKLTNRENILETQLNGEIIENTNETTYLGQQISFSDRTNREIETRITKAWNKFWSLKKIFKGPFKNHHKSEVFNLCVIPTLTYACQTWPLTVKHVNKIQTAQNSMERTILGIKRRDHIKIKDIKQKLPKNTQAATYIRRQKWRWAGHVARMRDDRWTYKTTFWYLAHFKRKKGRQLTRWRDDINGFLRGKNFQRIATDRIEWLRLQETFALYGPRKTLC
jgi:hypothetical protein